MKATKELRAYVYHIHVGLSLHRPAYRYKRSEDWDGLS